MSRIAEVFVSRKKIKKAALIPFLTAGDPSLAHTAELVLEMERQGADIIELGVPFSDPLADGPTIQAASQRALAQGVRLEDVIGLVRNLRSKTRIPFVLMTYYNPVLQYGLKRTAQKAAQAGVDGFIIPDLPPEEAEDWKREADKAGLDTIFLLAPTSDLDRIKKVVSLSRGFIYYVSVTGITGARKELPGDLLAKLKLIKKHAAVPVSVGFGISTPEQVAMLAPHADGIIVGSAIVNLIARHGEDPQLAPIVGRFVAHLKTGI
ncbi:MAG: tryptophan synthase subunit alpha [Thermodesulfobacteriota bacterium]|nr:tryptophan synthase subunit alpha [Thermodesulfobacteriota bacterium]